MPVMPEILAVPRPVNTKVVAYGKSKHLFAVKQRIGCKYDKGRRVPVYGPTIGHIVDGVYVPIEEPPIPPVSMSKSYIKEWANVVLCDNLFHDILDELRQVYNEQDALKIYCISILRVCRKGITDCQLKRAYENSFLSELYPDVALSKNTVSKFLNDIGRAYTRIVQFMKNRTASVRLTHHLLIDGTLKTNNSTINTLCHPSRKARIKGTEDISILYAYHLETMEPVCSKCFPGNMLDVTAYEKFISENGITEGILIGDKGFPYSSIKEYRQKHIGLHYLNPLKRNSKYIKEYSLLDFTECLNGYEGITCRKEKCKDAEKWLYSFRDDYAAFKEEHCWTESRKRKNTYDYDELLKKRPSFGTIVMESDLDLAPDVIYRSYESRWNIEILMRYYKQACNFDDTRVHDDYSVLGSELCNFLSSVLASRLVKKFDKAGLYSKNIYFSTAMDILREAGKICDESGEWLLRPINPSEIEILVKLDILPQPVPAKRKPGRPKKSCV